MNRHLLGTTLALAVLAPALEAGAQPIRVFVAAERSPARETPSEEERVKASAAYDAANDARKTLEKTLKAQYGNKRDKWPADAQEQLADAEQARDAANAAWMYRTQSEPVDDYWRQDIAKALTTAGRTGAKEHVTSVASASEAQLIVTLTAVRNPSAATNAADDRCLLVRVAAGPQISAARFAAVPRAYRPRRFKALRLSGPTDDAPFWRFEGCGQHPYFDPEEAIANIVDDFAGANRAALTGSAGQ